MLLRSLRYDYDKKNKLFFIPTLLSLRSYHEDKILFCCCYYVHYAMITTRNKLIFIPTLPSSHNSHEYCSIVSLKKSSVSKRFMHDTVVSPSGASVESLSIFFLRKFGVSKRFVHDALVSSLGTSVEPSYMLYYPY